MSKNIQMTISAEDILQNERFDLIGRSLNLAMENWGVKMRFRTDIVGKELVIDIEKG